MEGLSEAGDKGVTLLKTRRTRIRTLLLVGWALLTAFIVVYSLAFSRASVAPVWDTALKTGTGTPAQQAQAISIMDGECQALDATLKELEQLDIPQHENTDQENLTEGLDKLEQPIESSYPVLDTVLKSFSEVERRWRLQAERTISDPGPTPWKVSPLPEFALTAYQAAAGTSEAERYRTLYAEAYQEYQDKKTEHFHANEMTSLRNFQDILDIHRVRGKYLRVLIEELDYRRPLAPEPQQWRDVSLEIGLIAHRYKTFLAIKRTAFREYFSNGVLGWLEILREIGQIALSFLLPLGVFVALKAVSKWLSSLIYDQRRPNPNALLLLQLLPWLGALAVLTPVQESLTRNLALMELAIIPGIARYFIYYRVGVRLMRKLLTYLARQLLQRSGNQVRDRIERSVRVTVAVLVGAHLLVFLVRFTVGRSIIYFLFAGTISWVYLLILIFLGLYWRPLLPQLAAVLLGSAAGRRVEKFLHPPAGWVLAPFFLAAFILLALTYEILSMGRRFDWFNELLAQFFRRGTRESSLPTSAAPQDYVERFLATRDDQDSKKFQRAYQAACALTDQFLARGTTSTTLLLLGPRGSGKSAVQRRLAQKVSESIQVTQVEFGTRLDSEAELARVLGKEMLGLDSCDLQNLVAALSDDTPRMLIVRDAHNLFLSKPGGFEALKALGRVGVIPNLMLSLSFEPYSWRFLRGAMLDGMTDTAVVTLDRLGPEEIRDYILSRHRKVGYELIYDSNLMGGGFDSDDTPNLEMAYFHLLWDTSEGVPGIAEEIWLDNLELLENNVLRARIPKPVDFSVLANINREALFFFASLFRHETLTAAEAAMTTDLPLGLAEQVFKVAEQKAFLVQSPQGFRVSSLWYAPLARYLRRKNYLYGR